jgi:hypothetical protein
MRNEYMSGQAYLGTDDLLDELNLVETGSTV